MPHEKYERFVVADNTKNCSVCYGKGTRHDFAKNGSVTCIACKGTGKATK